MLYPFGTGGCTRLGLHGSSPLRTAKRHEEDRFMPFATSSGFPRGRYPSASHRGSAVNLRWVGCCGPHNCTARVKSGNKQIAKITDLLCHFLWCRKWPDYDIGLL